MKYKQIIQNIPLPDQDKLKHYFLGSILFLLAAIFVSEMMAMVITFGIATIKEVIDRITGSNRKFKEQALDIFYSVLCGLLIILIEQL